MSRTIRPAVAADFEGAKSMLQDAGLPVDDLAPGHLVFSAEENGMLLGAIGLESFGEIGLLRSLVVGKRARSAGVGRELVDALEDHARGLGIGELWLLTIDADSYFAKLGYMARERDAAPDAIRATREFAGLCPDDAVLMSKRI